MCDRDCNQGRRCPARLYPGTGKCSDLDNMDSGPIRAESHDEESNRIAEAEIALGIAWVLWAVLMLFAALDTAAREGFLDWF